MKIESFQLKFYTFQLKFFSSIKTVGASDLSGLWALKWTWDLGFREPQLRAYRETDLSAMGVRVDAGGR